MPRRNPLLILLACLALAGLTLAGCGVEARGMPEPTAGPPVAAASNADLVVCEPYVDRTSILRRTAESLAQMPVLPAAVAYLTIEPRRLAGTPGVTDPELAAAHAELVAAIDDLDAQAWALLGPEGDPVTEAVTLDPERILAAVTEVERLCAPG